MVKKKISVALAITLIVGSLTGCVGKKNKEVTKNEEFSLSKTIKPNQDFYDFVNENWIKSHPVPKNETSISNFTIVGKKVEKQIKDLILDKAKNVENEDQDGKNIGIFFNMAKDFEKRNKLGLDPIKPFLKDIESIKNISDFNKVSENLVKYNYSPAVQMVVMADQKDSKKNILYVAPIKIGMESQYYISNDEYSIKRQKAYKNYMKNIFEIYGQDSKEANKSADEVFNLEKDLASFMLKPEEKLDSNATYHSMSLGDLEKISPSINYKKMLESFGIKDLNKIVVSEPNAIKKTNELLNEKNLKAFKLQNIYRVIIDNQDFLGKNLIEANAKYVENIAGVYNVDSNEKLALKETEDVFDNILGKLYVEKYFDENTKKEVTEMVKTIEETYKKRIEKLDWLSSKTKKNAINKINKMELQVGYPNKWEDYSSIKVQSYNEGGNLVSNKNKVMEFLLRKMYSKVNKPTDKNEWSMPPQTVNAYYDMLKNTIVVPAGILQSPVYNPNSREEEKLGGLGAILGHEISHAIDSKGAQYDENGNLNPWWTEKDIKIFDEKVKQVADTFSKIEVVKGHKINGAISTGEIMADLGGITIVNDIVKEKKLDEKVMFESYARIWRDNTLEDVKIANLSDEHPPAKNRVNDIVKNLDDFYKCFDVKKGDKMYIPPKDRLKIW